MLKLAVYVGAAYAALLVFVFFFQARLLYLPDMPSRGLTATPADIGLDFEPVSITTHDGETLSAWYVPARQPRGTLLFFHGNAGNISHRLESISIFHRLRLNVLIVDYRGYGASTGAPSEQGTYNDALASWRYLIDTRGADPQDIVVFGRSLGGAVAVRLAGQVDPRTVILESTFTSVADAAAKHYPWLPVRYITRYRYDSLAAVASIRCPVMIVHSEDDEIIPFTHGERLFAAITSPKEFLRLRGGHNDGFVAAGDAYTSALDAFLTAYPGRPR
ncbi:MAG: alpha/beta hydrolase [Gammaproteobacteria bacterium]